MRTTLNRLPSFSHRWRWVSQSEQAREVKRKKEKAERALMAKKKSELAAQRLEKKRAGDRQEQQEMVKTALAKHAYVDKQLAAKKAEKERQIKEAQIIAAEKEQKRVEFAEERAVKEEEHVQNIVAERTRKNQTLGRYAEPTAADLSASRLCLNAAGGRVLEANEERNIVRSEEQAIKFEETVETIKRREKAEEFKRKELQVQQRTCSAVPLHPLSFCVGPGVRLRSLVVCVCRDEAGADEASGAGEAAHGFEAALRGAAVPHPARGAARRARAIRHEQGERTACNSPNASGKSR